jgi:DNA-binding transcriptional regulator YiaG
MYNVDEKAFARRLFVQSGETFAAIHERTKVSTSQLKKWSKRENWNARKAELLQAAKVGDSVAIYNLKAQENRAFRLLKTMSRRRRKRTIGLTETVAPKVPQMAPDDLLQLRLTAGLSQAELAESLEVKEKVISELEQGSRRISKVYEIALKSILQPVKARPPQLFQHMV